MFDNGILISNVICMILWLLSYTPLCSVVQPLINYVNMKAVHTDNNTMLDETSDRDYND